MGMKLELRPGSEFLKAHATGEFSLREAQKTFLEMLESVAQHKASKVLFDGRAISGEPRMIERFYYGEFAAQSVEKSATRGASRTQFAYVLLEPVLDSRRIGEIVAVNRGMFVRAFDNIEEAVEWLGSASANEPDAGDAR